MIVTNRILGSTHPSYCIYTGTIIDRYRTQVAQNTIIKQSLKNYEIMTKCKLEVCKRNKIHVFNICATYNILHLIKHLEYDAK